MSVCCDESQGNKCSLKDPVVAFCPTTTLPPSTAPNVPELTKSYATVEKQLLLRNPLAGNAGSSYTYSSDDFHSLSLKLIHKKLLRIYIDRNHEANNYYVLVSE